MLSELDCCGQSGIKNKCLIAVCSLLSRIFSCEGYFVSLSLYFEHLGQKICCLCIHKVRRESQLLRASVLPNSTELLQFILAKELLLAAAH